jgi:hypothetical protein
MTKRCITIPLHTDCIEIVVESEKLLAAGERDRCAASVTGCGSSLNFVCERLKSRPFDTLLTQLLLVTELLLCDGMEM